MALKKLQNYVPVVQRNKQDAGGVGVAKEDQIELSGTTTAPTTNLSNGRIYLNSSDNQFYGYANSLWFPLGGIQKIKSVTTSTTLTTSESGQVIKCSSVGGSLIVTLPSAATSGIVYYIVNDNADQSIQSVHIQESGYTGINHQWIAGASGTLVALNNRGDCVVLVSDGSTAWLSVARYS